MEHTIKTSPVRESLKLIELYLLVGVAWIFFSDKLLAFLVQDAEVIKEVQLYKGWLYVVMSSGVFFVIIWRKMGLYKSALEKVVEGYAELMSSYKEMIKLEQEQKSMEKSLYDLAYFDSLTGLPNKSRLKEQVKSLLESCENENKRAAFIYIDIDDFKHINETKGHEAGDELIVHISKKLSEIVKPPNLVARLGGDEFGIVLTEVKSGEISEKIKEIQSEIRKPWVQENQEFFISLSIGASIYPNHSSNFSSLLQNADIALSHIKGAGKDGYCIYTLDMGEEARENISIGNQLRVSIENRELDLYYQPQIDIKSRKIVGAEVLIRWEHPKRGFISPSKFIPIAESIGFIPQIEEWVFMTACSQKKAWGKQGLRDIKISINLSAKMTVHDELITKIHKLLSENTDKHCSIELEITETAIMADMKKAIEILSSFKELGATIALDDFGAGYSSLTYLQKLPIDILKIDKDFIQEIGKSKKVENILKMVFGLAHDLGLKVVAEGVETEEQFTFLYENQCDMAQGFYFYSPVKASEVVELLERKHDEADWY
jgi:diguanylate cyclase (GGDEF)-like protein